MTCLILDKNPQAREGIRNQLLTLGFRKLECVATLEEAIKWINDAKHPKRPHLFIVDKESLLELYIDADKALQTLEIFTQTTIVTLSSSENCHLQKPFGRKRLESAVLKASQLQNQKRKTLAVWVSSQKECTWFEALPFEDICWISSDMAFTELLKSDSVKVWGGLVVDAALFTNSKIAPDALQQFKQMREGAFLPLLCLGELGKAHSVLRSEANLTLSSAITAEALSALATKRDMGWFPSLVLGQQLHKKDHSKINDLKELIKKDPTNASALSLMGEDYENRGKIKEAWSYYQRALNHNCFCVPAHLGILRIIKVQGNSSVQNEINFAKQCCPNHPQVIALINELSKNKENVGGSLAA